MDSVKFTLKQVEDLLESGYIDSKIGHCESFLDDLAIENEDGELDMLVDEINQELDNWNKVKTALQNIETDDTTVEIVLSSKKD